MKFFILGFLLLSPASLQATSLIQELKTELAMLRLNAKTLNEMFEHRETREMDSVFTCDGRLTLETGVPVSTSDQVGATTIYFTPFIGDKIAVYNGTYWLFKSFTERSLALGTLTSGKTYDVFIYDNAGTLTLEFSSAWSSSTARTDALAQQDGVYVKSSDYTRRYLGSFYTTSTTTTEDSKQKRNVWNVCNKRLRPTQVKDTTDSWNYTTNTIRVANNSTATNRFSFVVGLLNEGIYTYFSHFLAVSDNDLAIPHAVDLRADGDFDSSAFGVTGASTYANASESALTHQYSNVGIRFDSWAEYGNTNATFYGDAGDASGRVQSGVIGYVEN